MVCNACDFYWILLRGEDDWLRAMRMHNDPAYFQILGSQRRVSIVAVEAVQPVN